MSITSDVNASDAIETLLHPHHALDHIAPSSVMGLSLSRELTAQVQEACEEVVKGGGKDTVVDHLLKNQLVCDSPRAVQTDADDLPVPEQTRKSMGYHSLLSAFSDGCSYASTSRIHACVQTKGAFKLDFKSMDLHPNKQDCWIGFYRESSRAAVSLPGRICALWAAGHPLVSFVSVGLLQIDSDGSMHRQYGWSDSFYQVTPT